MAILFSGCTGSHCRLVPVTGYDHGMINSNTPATLDGENDRGVHVSISRRTSVKINVDGIMDYVQRWSTFGHEPAHRSVLTPWIRLDLSY